ncbi:hypothetical protein ACWGH7_07505 [Streptomyces cyaneofuscatus]|uniref:hypothetical protein n=1 Tax=Streptomyces TaxID=1883 RepID=UPI0004C4A417|nr:MULTISPECIES: hypothetical protein [Streptomyces]ONI50755.1 hypothetical protein STIB_52640 [Streptomyces sp. IB2014 011-1]RDV50170.1 hypothetical protein DDV98_20565 [Streptomyces sp. IB2014 011-12]CAD5933121.1 conserved protein of unknown function [Streptomyces sp. KY75]CAD5988217.1 conserved protein of unknown function [Streptomyces sp. KY70]
MTENFHENQIRVSLNFGDDVGPEYFDDTDRVEAVSAGVRLVNALRRFDVDFDGIGVSQVCHTCTVVEAPYLVALGNLRPAEAVEIAKKIDEYAVEFQRMDREIKSLSHPKPKEAQAENLDPAD